MQSASRDPSHNNMLKYGGPMDVCSFTEQQRPLSSNSYSINDSMNHMSTFKGNKNSNLGMSVTLGRQLGQQGRVVHRPPAGLSPHGSSYNSLSRSNGPNALPSVVNAPPVCSCNVNTVSIRDKMTAEGNADQMMSLPVESQGSAGSTALTAMKCEERVMQAINSDHTDHMLKRRTTQRSEETIQHDKDSILVKNQFKYTLNQLLSEGMETSHNAKPLVDINWSDINSLASSQTDVDKKTGKALEVGVYLKSRVAIQLELENGLRVTCQELVQILLQLNQLNLPSWSSDIFCLWMCSALLELQLKPVHQPYRIRKQWRKLLDKYSNASPEFKERDEPAVVLQRNVFYPKSSERKLREEPVLELLFAEAKSNVLRGFYVLSNDELEQLAAIQTRIEYGQQDLSKIYSHAFIRSRLSKLLPHYTYSSVWPWLSRLGFESSQDPTFNILEYIRSLSSHLTLTELYRLYLEICWKKPYYGAAFFRGQIASKRTKWSTLLGAADVPVLVAISGEGVHIISEEDHSVWLSLQYEHLIWDYAEPRSASDEHCLPCLFLGLEVVENGCQVQKILQVFSRQAKLMDTLMSAFDSELAGQHGENGGTGTVSAAERDDGDSGVSGDSQADLDEPDIPLTHNWHHHHHHEQQQQHDYRNSCLQTISLPR